MVPALTTLLQRVEVKVQQTRRRQGTQAALAVLPLCLTVSLLFTVVWAVVAPSLRVELPIWIPLVAGISFGLVAALVWGLWQLPNRTRAALALDKAFGLQERIVTLATLTAAQQKSEAGQLLAGEMDQRLNQLSVPQGFPLASAARRWLAPMGAAITLLVALLFPAAWIFSGSKSLVANNPEKSSKDAEQKPLDLSVFKQANEERKKRLKEIGSEMLNDVQHDIDELLQKLEQTKEGSAEAKLALEDLTKLTEKVQARESAKDKIEEIKKQLKLELGEKMPADKGPAEQFTQALAKADFDKAKQELMKLAEKVQKGEMSKEEMKELAKQMSNLKSKLEEIAKQKEKLEALEKSNLDPETKQKEKEKIEKELEKLKDLADLAEKMKEAVEELEKGDKEAAREALEKMAEDLQKMEMGEQELGELQLTEADLDELKAAIAGMKGKGGKRGKKGDQWGGEKDWGQDWNNEQGQPGQGGNPTNQATEGGLRDEALDNTKSDDTTAKSKSNPAGKMTVVGTGPKQGKPGKDQVKNRVELTAADLDQTKQQASEALKQQKISQTQRDVVSDFYKNLAPAGSEKKQP